MTEFLITTVDKRLAFAEKAALAFENDPRLATYGDMAAGNYLAIKWGLMDRSVMVVQLSDDMPVLYTDLIKPRE